MPNKPFCVDGLKVAKYIGEILRSISRDPSHFIKMIIKLLKKMIVQLINIFYVAY